MSETFDPLEALREPVVPVDPDPVFAATLRARLRRALLDRTGVSMTTNTESAAGETTSAEGDVQYVSLWLPDVLRAEAFYGSVLGWQFAPGSGQHGRQIVGLPTQHIGMWGRTGHNTSLVSLGVENVQETVRKVRAAGGAAEEPSQQPYGLAAMCADDQGMAFSVLQSPAAERGPVPEAGPGEIVYLTFEAVDSARFRAFFGAVFGWRFTPGRSGDRWNINGIHPFAGLSGGNAQTTIVPQFLVSDLDAALERLRAAGGSANEPQPQPYGRSTDCVDDQGTRFYLAQL
ncbi:MAG TPA: VOC family protein [Pseudonocardiaceae bacterium]|nr:VOC family protein [Pseudonocardiaceae bacterium]